jgi:hypothetical protein
MEDDPYRLLGVPPDADLRQIRAAYRRAALACHPDNRPADRQQAEEAFRALTDAYRVAARAAQARARAGPPPAVSPEQMNGEEPGWPFLTIADDSPAAVHVRRRPGARKESFPAVNENRAFACAWMVAVALAVAAAASCSLAVFGAPGEFRRAAGAGENALLVGMMLLVYGGILAGTIGLLLASRRIVWLVFRPWLTRRALPDEQHRDQLPPPANPKFPPTPDA